MNTTTGTTELIVPEEITDAADALIADGRPIKAIKIIRDATDCTLIEARVWVEARAGRPVDPRADGESRTTETTMQPALMCEITTGPHYPNPAPAVVVMPGGTLLCAACAHVMLTHALATGRDFHVDPVPQPAATP